MKSFHWLVLSFVFLIQGLVTQASPRCSNPWVFLDLGDTLVDTKTNKYDPMFYMRDVARYADGQYYSNSKGYVDSLRASRHPLGMIVDIPESWGKDYTEKLNSLKLFTQGQYSGMKSSWKDTVAMDWTPFEGMIFLPLNDTERKRSHSAVMFQRALEAVDKAGCKAIYQGEDEAEMALAESAGMIPFWIGKTSKSYFYLPIHKMNQYIRNYKKDGWKAGSIL